MMKLLIITAAMFFIHTVAAKTTAAERPRSQNLMFSEPNIQSNGDILSSLNGRIVYVETQVHKGYWIYAQAGTPYLAIRAKDQLLEEVPYKWKLHYLGGNKIALESVQIRNDYLSIRVNSRVGNSILKTTGDPASDTWVHIELQDLVIDSSRTMLSTYLTFPASQKYGKYMIVAYGGIKYTTLSPRQQKWNIYVPDASDEYVTVSSLDNRYHTSEANFEISVTVGFEVTRGETVTESVETTLGFELQGAFMGIGASASGSVTHSKVWEKQSSQTWSKSTTTTVHTTVAPGKRVELRQLVGHYGGNNIEINSGSYQFVDPDANKVVNKNIAEMLNYAVGDSKMSFDWEDE